MGQALKDRQIIWLQPAIYRFALSVIVFREKIFPRLSALIFFKLSTEIPNSVDNFGSSLQIDQKFNMLKGDSWAIF